MRRILTIAHMAWLKMLRKKDLYVLFVLLLVLLVTLVSLNILGMGGTSRYVKGLGVLMVWIFSWVLAVNVSAREIPEEESKGTIFPLLAKPITRFELVLGKWLGAWSITTAATIVFYVAVMLMTIVKGGEIESMGTLFQAIVLHCSMLSIIVAISLFFSMRMNYDAAVSMSYVLTVSAYLIVPRAPAFVAKMSGLHADIIMFLYQALPHFEIFDMRTRLVHGHGPISWKIFFLVVSYGVLTTAFFIVLSWMSYRKKRFSRSILT